MNKKIFLVLISLLVSWSSCFAASIPQTLNYHGTLQTNTSQPVNVPTDITFSLYNTPIGAETPFWSEVMPKVPVSNGQFSVTLGATASNPINPSKFSGDTYIGIKVGTQPEMTPRQKMTSVPYALSAASALNGIPSGGVIMWSGTTVPSGWALCDGSNGTPDLRDRFVVGIGNRFGSGKAKGSTGGEEDHVLSIDEMPNHNHGGGTGGMSQNHKHEQMTTGKDDSNFSHAYGQAPAADASNPGPSGSGTYTNWADSDHYHGISGQGGGQPHNNLPPYYALAFIMKL